MNPAPESDALLVVPHIRIQNANAVSSPMTHGFPAITAFLGLMWALERRFRSEFGVVFDSIGVVCHWHQELSSGDRYQKSFNLTRNPVDKTGATAAIVEEGRVHLELTLLFGIGYQDGSRLPSQNHHFSESVAEALATMRVAGGTVVPNGAEQSSVGTYLDEIPPDADDRQKWFRRLRRRLLPGFALVGRDALLARQHEAMQRSDGSTSLLDAWLHLSRFNWSPAPESEDDDSGKMQWTHDRTEGWIVPIPVGYGALCETHAPGAVANARDPHTPFRFVESLYSIGQWVAPHRLRSWRQLQWYDDSDSEAGLYRARNDFELTAS